MATSDFEKQDFDCSLSQLKGGGGLFFFFFWKVCLTKSLLSVLGNNPDRPDGHHASRSFNGLNAPTDGPHPG